MKKQKILVLSGYRFPISDAISVPGKASGLSSIIYVEMLREPKSVIQLKDFIVPVDVTRTSQNIADLLNQNCLGGPLRLINCLYFI